MLKKIILLLLILLIQNATNSMEGKLTGEEENLPQLTHLRKTTLEIEPSIKKAHILFLCTGNSCRSQMSEGWARYLGSEVAEVNSAGIEAHGLNPNAIKVMKEVGIDITSQSSKVVTSDMICWADLVVTVCGNADESCPHLSLNTQKIHWPLIDPAKAMGTEEEVIKKFQAVRDEIQQHVVELLMTLK